VTARGASMGTTPSSIPSRLQRGEPVDVFIMVGDALECLMEQGKVAAGTRTDLARSSIGVAVRAGAPKPDIGSVDAFKRAMLDAKSLAYSSSASGVYLSTELFPRLGIADQVKGKSRMIGASRSAPPSRGVSSRLDCSRSANSSPCLAWISSAHCRPRFRRSLCSLPESPQALENRTQPECSSNSSLHRRALRLSRKAPWNS
jgi:hypothetical protein